MTYAFVSALPKLQWGHAVASDDDDSWTTAEIVRSMRRMEVKLDKALDSHEFRISKLERLIATLIGISIGSAGGSVAAIVTSILG